MGKNVHVDFGNTENEVVVFSDFTSKATVWCLQTGRTVEIRDPKFSGKEGRGWGYRPDPNAKIAGRAALLAILCRTGGQDVLLLLAPRTHDVVRREELPTVDAAGMKWSRDGRWIAVWDAASSGYHLHIFTADGHLYRSISRETMDEHDQWSVEGLGIKSVEWVPGNQWLAVGGWDRRVRILSTRTFSPVVFLDHTSQIQVPSAPVYTELVDGSGNRSYSLAQQPVVPPTTTGEKGELLMKQGINIIAFNADGTLCATRDDSTPTTIWIWDLRSLRPKMILLQYSPVKSLQWHPSNSTLLLIQATHDSATLYLCSIPPSASASEPSPPGAPEILNLSKSISKPTGSAQAKWEARWLSTPQDKKPAFLFGHQQGYTIIWPEGRDRILRLNEDGDESDDSLYDILTGRTPIPRLHNEEPEDFDEDFDDSRNFGGVEVDDMATETYQDSTSTFQDTFREKRKAVEAARGQSIFDESGLDEMF
jgi:WD40 repeat protein